MVEDDAATASVGPKSARGRVRVGGARGGEAGSAKFELIEQSVTTVKNWNFLNEKRDFELPPASDGFDPGDGI
jgi:hypothetical protein